MRDWSMAGGQIARDLWVRVDDLVYDVSDIVEHGPHIDPQIRTTLRACGGAECTDENMRFNLQHMNVAPVMGRLVREERKPKRKRADAEVEREERIKKKARRSEMIERVVDNTLDCGTSQQIAIDSLIADQQRRLPDLNFHIFTAPRKTWMFSWSNHPKHQGIGANTAMELHRTRHCSW
ncbi:hypothetical protein B0T22DRAFT_177257 [Podospora appendiculata]|uniref:Cytochrome b5 heme-binding domain-containing protein n=1 Tax=Podospora appendiculata TaxID=314037 RepID=A0AAE0XC21_9PEZI|nr:hypothetical protein B0T22DRAFT_177257 [Podospora appendiculata]